MLQFQPTTVLYVHHIVLGDTCICTCTYRVGQFDFQAKEAEAELSEEEAHPRSILSKRSHHGSSTHEVYAV